MERKDKFKLVTKCHQLVIIYELSEKIVQLENNLFIRIKKHKKSLKTVNKLVN